MGTTCTGGFSHENQTTTPPHLRALRGRDHEKADAKLAAIQEEKILRAGLSIKMDEESILTVDFRTCRGTLRPWKIGPVLNEHTLRARYSLNGGSYLYGSGLPGPGALSNIGGLKHAIGRLG